FGDEAVVATAEAEVRGARDEADAGAARQDLGAQPVGGAVGRAVVEDQDLVVDAGIVQLRQRGETGLQVPPAVPGEDGDRDLFQRMTHRTSLQPRRRRRMRSGRESGGAVVPGRWTKRSLVSSL